MFRPRTTRVCVQMFADVRRAVTKLLAMVTLKYSIDKTLTACNVLCRHSFGQWDAVAVNMLCPINEVNRRRPRLVLRWVTVCRRVNHLCVLVATQVNSA